MKNTFTKSMLTLLKRDNLWKVLIKMIGLFFELTFQ